MIDVSQLTERPGVNSYFPCAALCQLDSTRLVLSPPLLLFFLPGLFQGQSWVKVGHFSKNELQISTTGINCITSS